jgi:hypothetical protein
MNNKHLISIAILLLYVLQSCSYSNTSEKQASCQPIRENEELSSNVSPNSDSLYIYDHNSGNIIVDSLSIDDIRTITITEYPMAYYSNKYVSSPYGLIRINDENMVLELYKLLSEKSVSNYTDSINSRILMEIFRNSDASLSVCGSTICRNDFMNKTDIVLNICRSDDSELVDNYMNIIGFAFEDYGVDGSPSLEAYIDTLKSHVCSPENHDALQKAISIIKKSAVMISNED